MEINSEQQKKNKDSGVNVFRNFFEIKRPAKPLSATLPRTKGKMEDNNNLNKERLFVRHQSSRKSSRRIKYKKESVQKSTIEVENRVKKLCEKFEETKICYVDTTHEEKKVLTKQETNLDLLRDIHNDIEVKKRLFEKNNSRQVKSFVEANDDEKTEEYRRSLISEMDMEIAQMREDGFIDDDENTVSEYGYFESASTSNYSPININDYQLTIEDMDTLRDKRMISKPELNRESSDSDTHTIILDQIEIEKESTDIKVEDKTPINSINDIVLYNNYNDEFTESLGDDLENGLFIVEAYNDDGRELIEVQVMIDRKAVNLDPKSLEEAINDSEMVFYENEDHTFNCIQDSHANSLLEFPSHSKTSVNSEDRETPNYQDANSSLECPSHSRTSENSEDTEIAMYQHPQEDLEVFAPLSNRSTIYSTTSQDSSTFDEDDEGIELGRNKDNQEEIYTNVRRETFCDDKGIVRIERIAFSNNLSFPNEANPVSRSNSSASSKKLDFIIDEIKSTEKKYVEDLAKVVQLYKPYIDHHSPPNLKPYQGYLFGNIEKIYRRQRKFRQCLEKAQDVEDVVECFIDHEFLFEMYPHYFRNKPKADQLLKEFSLVIKEMQETFEERLDFSAYLLTPVQRLGKYILFLGNIEKQLEKLELPTERVQKALAIIKEEMSKGNDSVAIESIENSPISKMDYGSFKMREKFSINKPRKLESMVFLFHNVLVFTICDAVKLEIFNYYDSIKMLDLRIATYDDLTIHLTDFTKSKKKQNSTKYTYILEAKSEKVWKIWKETIEKMLWDQLVKAKELTKNQQVNKRHKTGERSRLKSAGSSVFYCN